MRIGFELWGEVARCVDTVIQIGIVRSKPDATRQALREYFNRLDKQQLECANGFLIRKRLKPG